LELHKFDATQCEHLTWTHTHTHKSARAQLKDKSVADAKCSVQ